MVHLKVFEAFAGVGSQHMALRNLGVDYEVVGVSEIDKFAHQSYEAIHGETKNFGDISKLQPEDLPDFDLFTYSFLVQISVPQENNVDLRGVQEHPLLFYGSASV